MAIVRSTSQWAAIEVMSPSSSTRYTAMSSVSACVPPSRRVLKVPMLAQAFPLANESRIVNLNSRTGAIAMSQNALMASLPR